MNNNMIYFHSPNLTHGKCPHCEKTFDANKAKIAFPGNVKGKCISFVFALCPECNEVFASGDNSKQKEIIKTSYLNFFKKDPYGDWTVTSSIALSAHGGHFFDAWWNGIDIPRALFDALNDGLIDEVASFPPFWRS
jgi:hypothetical protein